MLSVQTAQYLHTGTEPISHPLQTLESHHKICTRMLFPGLYSVLKKIQMVSKPYLVLFFSDLKNNAKKKRDRIRERTITVLDQM